MATEEDFEIKGVLPGKYNLLAVTVSRDDPAAAKPIIGAMQAVEVGEGGIDDLDVSLKPLPDIAGKVEFAEGCSPLQVRLSVRARNLIGPAHPDITSTPDGSFTLSALTPGRIMLYITPQPNVRPSSVLLGDRDVLKDGFDYPVQEKQTLRVLMQCGPQRRVQ